MYPVTYEADYVRERNRLTVFFRYILAIPWEIVAIIYYIAAIVVVIIAWFALLFTGRYPEGMYRFVSGVIRYGARVGAWYSLQTDEWPSFGLADDPTYPVRIGIAPPEKQSRLKVFFRGILAIPLFILAYPISFIHTGATIASWLTIVFRGYQPAGIHNALLFTNSFNLRFGSYAFGFLTDAYPPVGDEGPAVGDERPAVAAPQADTAATVEKPVPPAPPAPPAPGDGTQGS
jgi:hypothetical protein